VTTGTMQNIEDGIWRQNPSSFIEDVMKTFGMFYDSRCIRCIHVIHAGQKVGIFSSRNKQCTIPMRLGDTYCVSRVGNRKGAHKSKFKKD